MPSLDWVVDVAGDAHAVLGLGAREPSQVEVVDHERHLDLTGEVGKEEGDALEHADHDEGLVLVVAGDLAAKRAHARLELDRRDEDLADVLLAKMLDLQ